MSQPGPDLTAICDLCAQLITANGGYLWVDNDEVAKVAGRVTAWEAEHPADEPMSGDNLMTRPAPARWRVTHANCDPGPSGDSYEIELDRIRTFRDLAGWTVHLMQKPWLRYTDWTELVEDALGGNGGRLKSHYAEPWDG